MATHPCYILTVFLFCCGLLPEQTVQQLNVLHITDSKNKAATSVMTRILSLVNNTNTNEGITLKSYKEIQNTNLGSYNFVNETCDILDSLITQGNPPHIVIDTTLDGLSSDIVKAITKALQVPIVSATYGHETDGRYNE
ncbi:unnamed protein product [Cyprideis torosa]|uniref:Uncharacterized protein n=1 Tax=Cyprideis torosa TaxID=163714 RepID=A0A7R8ZLD1_9CRUS|nr:unnamed protein product [Cyprideis torosa]CAG0883410.1 unnamed protein product [Cyprideis torosa]